MLQLLLAAAGLTNEYLINTCACAALRYNDQSVNENTHAALGFELLLKPGNNFLQVLRSCCQASPLVPLPITASIEIALSGCDSEDLAFELLLGKTQLLDV